MAVKFLNLLDWNGPDLPQIADFSDGGGSIGSGHPQTIVILVAVTSTNPNTPIVSGQLFNVYGYNDNRSLSLSLTLTADDFDNPDGKKYNGVEYFPDGFWAGELGLHIFDEPENYTCYINIQIGTSDTPRPVDDPPSPDGILPPTNLVATSMTGFNQLTWQDNSTNELGFEIEWSTVPAGAWELFATPLANDVSYDDYDIEPGEVYSYRVRAFKSDMSSTYSNIATTEDQPLVLTPKQGPISGRTPFIIKGAFNPSVTNTVKFDQSFATEIVVTSTQISGLTPTHVKGLVDVTVTRGSRVDVLSNEFEFTEGRLYPHIEVSDPQYFSQPLPSGVNLTAVIVDDPDGVFENPRWEWELVQAPTNEAAAQVLIESPTTDVTRVVVRVNEQGRYLFQITATGKDAGNVDVTISNIAQVTISSASAPKVQSLQLTTRYPSSVYVEPSVEDDGANGPLTFQWVQLQGPGVAIIASPNSRGTEIQFPVEMGTYSFRLTASNNALSGSGVTKVVNYSDTAPTSQPALSTMNVNIGGVDY